MVHLDDRAEADRIAAMDAEELDLLLGEAALQDSMFSKPLGPDEVRVFGRGYFEGLLPVLRERLCQHATVCALFSKEHKERTTLILALAEQLTGIKLPLVLAARILYFGFERLCPELPAKE